jgi:hypothetical protein
MRWRDYDPSKDQPAVRRIWQETGWLDEYPERAMDCLLGAGRALVAKIGGEAECLVNSALGHMRYLNEELRFSGCTGVTTSRIARRQGFARRLLARLIAADVADGALVAGLGMFDQGFYDTLGFGTGTYDHWVAFDPAALKVNAAARVPQRLTTDDSTSMHACRRARIRGHGALNFDSAAITDAEWPVPKKGFALGYRDGPSGEITHHLSCVIEGAENGPYEIRWLAYRTKEQFLELMALMKGFADQVHVVRMNEPPGVQMQALLDRPFRLQSITEKSKYENRISAYAGWQMRICDLPGCLERTHLPCGEVRFNLKLTDPIERFLAEEKGWRGVGGDYVVTLGPSSGAERGADPALPSLNASVNAFTRLWLGVQPATGLAFTDDLSGPQELLEALDAVLRLPEPMPDWGF